MPKHALGWDGRLVQVLRVSVRDHQLGSRSCIDTLDPVALHGYLIRSHVREPLTGDVNSRFRAQAFFVVDAR